MNSLKNRLFSSAEAEKITAFLSKKFDIRLPAVQYSQAGGLLTLSSDRNQGRGKTGTTKKPTKGEDFFYPLFLRLQAAVQENLLDFNGARSLVRETISHYPTAKDHLHR